MTGARRWTSINCIFASSLAFLILINHHHKSDSCERGNCATCSESNFSFLVFCDPQHRAKKAFRHVKVCARRMKSAVKINEKHFEHSANVCCFGCYVKESSSCSHDLGPTASAAFKVYFSFPCYNSRLSKV